MPAQPVRAALLVLLIGQAFNEVPLLVARMGQDDFEA